MKQQSKILVLTTATAALFSIAATTAQADWNLNNDQSSLFYLTTKNIDITELNTFDRLHGSINTDGSAEVKVDLVSVETFIPIRDERMREMFFHVDTFPTANVTMQVDANALAALNPGERMVFAEQDVELTLNGETQSYKLNLAVVGLVDGSLQISNLEPLVVETAHHDLTDEVEALRAIAGIDSITHNAPVNFNLVFDKN